MTNKFDLVTVMTNLGAGASEVISIGGAVSSGKTRFLTYIKISRAATLLGSAATDVTAIVVSAAESAAGLTFSEISTTGKLPMHLAGQLNCSGESGLVYPEVVAEVHAPNKPNMNHPICSVIGGASAFMVLAVQSGPATRIFAQYYDA